MIRLIVSRRITMHAPFQILAIPYNLVGYIPVDELINAEQARPKSCLFQEI